MRGSREEKDSRGALRAEPDEVGGDRTVRARQAVGPDAAGDVAALRRTCSRRSKPTCVAPPPRSWLTAQMSATGMSESPTDVQSVRTRAAGTAVLSAAEATDPRTSWNVRLLAARYHRESRTSRFRPSSWTNRYCTHSFGSSSVARAPRRDSRTRCRRAVSGSALPLLPRRSTSGWSGLVVLLPEDADARDAAERSWFLGDEAVGLLPSRGVRGVGAPPPHLVGERARAPRARGGGSSAPRRGARRGLPRRTRPEPTVPGPVRAQPPGRAGTPAGRRRWPPTLPA